MLATDFIRRLDGVRARGSARWAARCPGHADINPSLSICEGEKGLLVKCWAGCALPAITQAMGLKVSDLFFDTRLPRGHRPAPKPAHVNRRALAFRFELAALDRRLRAKAVLKEVAIVCVSGLEDTALDRLINVVSSAYGDCDRAQLFESVSDDLRLKESDSHRGVQHAA